MKNKPTPPAGTTGLCVAPWSPNEIYAVAADWADAKAPIQAWDGQHWYDTPYQVADARHSPREALEILLREGNPETYTDFRAIVRDAEQI